MQSSILPGAVEPRTGMLESAPREGAGVMSNAQTEEGAFDKVIKQAVGEPECKSTKKDLMTPVIEDDSGEKEGAVDSKTTGQEEAKPKISLPEGLMCNVLLQMLVEPAAKVAQPEATGSKPVIVPEEVGETMVPAPVLNPVLTQDVKGGDAVAGNNTGKALKPDEVQVANVAAQPQLPKGSVNPELLGLVPAKETEAKIDVPLEALKTYEKTAQTRSGVPEPVNAIGSGKEETKSVTPEGRPNEVILSKAQVEVMQGRILSDEHAESMPKGVPNEARPRLVTPEITPKTEHEETAPAKDGTGTAKSTETMQNTADTGPIMQSLPSKTAKSAGVTEFVEADNGKLPRSAKDDVQAISPRGEVVTAGTTLLATEPMKKETSVTGVADVEKVEGQIRTQAVEFKRIGADSMSVVLKPDAQTELHMQLRMEQGQVHVVVECKRGDAAALNGGWGQLQQSLAGQGIRVSELQNSSGTNFSQEDGSGNFQRQEWQQEQNGDRTTYRYFAEDEKAAGSRSLVLPAAKGVRPSIKAGGKHSLEMWA
jgi:hypothetical protein